MTRHAIGENPLAQDFRAACTGGHAHRRQRRPLRIAFLPHSYYRDPMLRTVTVKLHDRVLADIESEARSRRVSRSEVVRERLERSKTSKGSVWDKMQDLVVKEDRAPTDLASNKARLRGYGRSGTG